MTWGVGSYNSNPALNNQINGIDIGEFSNAAGYNDALRQIMADIAAWIVSPGLLASLGGLDVSFRDINPITKSGAFTFADAERGRGITFNGASPAAATINQNATTPITLGAIYPLYNSGSANLTLTRAGATQLFKNGGTTSADVVLAPGAEAVLKKWGTDVWTVIGLGIT